MFSTNVIAPGVRTSAETLFRRTSKLPATEITPPKKVIGRRTEECIRSGVVLGSAEAIGFGAATGSAMWATVSEFMPTPVKAFVGSILAVVAATFSLLAICFGNWLYIYYRAPVPDSPRSYFVKNMPEVHRIFFEF